MKEFFKNPLLYVHQIFIMASIVGAAVFGLWSLNRAQSAQSSTSLVIAGACLASTAGLVFYLLKFQKKLKATL